MAVIPLSVSNQDKIVIIAPHPDDECIGTGGLLALYPTLCDVIVLTDGRQGQKKVNPSIEKEIRKKEFEEEMNYLHISTYKMLGYEDGTLMQHMDCLDNFDFSIYTKIFLPWGDDNHPDHTAAYLCSIEQIKKQNIQKVELYQYEVHVPFHDVTHVLDISSVIEEKRKLIQFHKCQLAAFQYDKLAEALGKYRACQCNLPGQYFEAYMQTDIKELSLSNEIVNREKTLQKYMQFYRVLIRWLNIRPIGSEIAAYLLEHRIKRVAIYGYADMGNLLYKELMNSDVIITCILDKRTIKNQNIGLEIVNPIEGDKNSDAVLVTAIYYYNEIKAELETLGYRNIVSLQNLIEEL